MKKLLLFLLYVPMISLGQYSINTDKIKLVQNKSSILIDFIWEIKYTLVLSADSKVYLDLDTFLDDQIDFNYFEVSYSDLSTELRGSRIVYLQNKSNRDVSTQFFNSGDATKLKRMIEDYESTLLRLVNGDKNMIKKILTSINTDDSDDESWERYNFYDMPVVGALTFLSKWQLDIKSIESDVISHILD